MLCFTELVDLKLWYILGFTLGKYGFNLSTQDSVEFLGYV